MRKFCEKPDVCEGLLGWINAAMLSAVFLETNHSEKITIKIWFFFFQINAFENGVCKALAILFRPQGVKT